VSLFCNTRHYQLDHIDGHRAPCLVPTLLDFWLPWLWFQCCRILSLHELYVYLINNLYNRIHARFRLLTFDYFIHPYFFLISQLLIVIITLYKNKTIEHKK